MATAAENLFNRKINPTIEKPTLKFRKFANKFPHTEYKYWPTKLNLITGQKRRIIFKDKIYEIKL